MRGQRELQLNLALLFAIDTPALVDLCVEWQALHEKRRQQSEGADADQHEPNDTDAVRKCHADLAAEGLVERRDQRDRRVRDRDAPGEVLHKVLR